MNQPAERQSVGRAAFVGYLITAFAVLAVPLFSLAPEQRSVYFWYKVAWVEFLAVVVWAYLGGASWSITPATGKGVLGALSGYGLLVFCYAGMSFLLVLLGNWLGRGQWVAQFGLMLGFALLYVTLDLARVGAVVGAEPIPSEIRAPLELAAMLRLHEDRLWTSSSEAGIRRLSEAIKVLRERLQYSLPHVGRLGQIQEYHEFARQTEAFCSDLQDLPVDSPEQATVARFRDRAMRLAGQSEQISTSLRIRSS